MFLSVSYKSSELLRGKTMVSFANESGTPALEDSPKVAKPLPAFTSKESTCP